MHRIRPLHALRHIAVTLAFTMAWLIVGPAIGAYAQAHNDAARNSGHARQLTPTEMQNVTGRGGAGIAESETTSMSVQSGPSFPWEGRFGDIDTGNGNKTSALSLFGWSARGGRLPAGFTLYHNSESAYSDELGPKVTHTYDLYIAFVSGTPNHERQVLHV